MLVINARRIYKIQIDGEKRIFWKLDLFYLYLIVSMNKGDAQN